MKTQFGDVTVTCYDPAKGKSPARYLVKRGERILGLLEKYRDSRTEKHPWKAFFGIGWECRFLDSYYPEEGGYDAAVNAVVSAS